jgi:formamidopyrimidine-DNA glycosylase
MNEHYLEYKDKKLLYQREYRKTNKDKIKQLKNKYYLKHRKQVLQYNRKYRKEHKDEIREHKKEYYLKHKEEILQKKKNYYQEHKKEILEKQKKRYENNKSTILQRKRKYKRTFNKYVSDRLSRWREIGVKINSWQEYVDVYNRAGGKCEICGKPLKLTKFDDGDFEVARLDHDHETGMIRGILCDDCNHIAISFDLNKKALEYLKNSELKNIISIEDKKTPKEIRIEREKSWKRSGINISWGEYVALFNMAGGKCEICGKPLKLTKADDGDGEVANVDHDHVSGRPRGIVCRRCNSLIKTMELNEKALKYLGGEKL